MNYLLVCIFTMYSGMIFSQSYRMGNVSKWNNMKYSISCDLQLLKENKYCITFSINITPDQIYGLNFSYGSFEKKDNQYYLKDMPSGATIILEKAKHSNLFVKRGFCFMTNEYFFKTGDIVKPNATGIDFEKYGKKRNGQETLFQTRKKSDLYPLQLGTYCNRGVSLTLDVDYRFRIFLVEDDLSFLISEGKWSKNGNKLELYDNCLDYTFLALVEAEKLIMIRFPNGLPLDEDYSLVKSKIYPVIVR